MMRRIIYVWGKRPSEPSLGLFAERVCGALNALRASHDDLWSGGMTLLEGHAEGA
jgi:hypothetical protein